MSTIFIKVKDNKAYLMQKTSKTITTGNVGTVKAVYEFSEEWDGYTKTAVMYSKKDGKDKAVVSPLINNEVEVDPSVISEKYPLYIGVFGDKGKLRKTSDFVVKQLTEGATPEGALDPEKTQDIYSKIVEVMNDAKEIAQSVRNDADEGKFNYNLTEEDIKEIAGKVDLSNLVPKTRKVANKELKEDIEAEDIINSFYDNTGKAPLNMLEILLEKSSVIGNKANKTEALKLVQMSLKSNYLRLEYVNGNTTYTEIFGLQELLENIETNSNAIAELKEIMPTVLDTIEITEECVGALTFENILEYFKEYKQLKIFGFMPYTATNTSAGNITIAGHGNSDFNMSASYYYFQKSGLQTSTRLKRLYFEINPLWTSEADTVYYEASGAISESTAYSPYTNTYKSGTFPNNGMVIGDVIIPLRKLSIYQAQTWAVGTKFYLLGVK